MTSCGFADAAPPLTVGGAKPQNVRVSIAPLSATDTLKPGLAMVVRTRHEIDLTPAEVETIRKSCKPFKGADGSWDAATRVGYLTCESSSAKAGTYARATYELRGTDRAAVLLRGVDSTKTWTVDPTVAPRQLLAVAGLGATPGQPDDALIPGKEVEVKASAGVLHISPALLKQRLFSSTSFSIPDTHRDLSTGRVLIRVPATLKADSYCGLLVWVHAGDEAALPDSLIKGADTLGLVLATQVDAGNGSPVVTRFQRISDTLATVLQRVHIDPDRIYIGGISGGGKISLMYAAAFPEVFSGVLSVVGFGTYVQTANREGIGIWPAIFDRSTGEQWKLFKSTRLAAITGDRDFNYAPIRASVEVFARDKLTCRLFDIPGLGHTVPDAATILEALTWIEEPIRATRQTAQREAQEALDSQDGNRQEKLKTVIELAPFSPAAWSAMKELGK